MNMRRKAATWETWRMADWREERARPKRVGAMRWREAGAGRRGGGGRGGVGVKKERDLSMEWRTERTWWRELRRM